MFSDNLNLSSWPHPPNPLLHREAYQLSETPHTTINYSFQRCQLLELLFHLLLLFLRVYLSPNPFPKPLDQSNPEPAPVHSSTTALALENPYRGGYPSPWTDFNPSPSAEEIPDPHNATDHRSTAAYLCPNTITRPINKRSLSSASIHSSSTAISSASPYDPGYPSPWTDVTSSPSSSNRADPLEEVSKKSTKTKRPCLTRVVSKKVRPTLAGLHCTSVVTYLTAYHIQPQRALRHFQVRVGRLYLWPCLLRARES